MGDFGARRCRAGAPPQSPVCQGVLQPGGTSPWQAAPKRPRRATAAPGGSELDGLATDLLALWPGPGHDAQGDYDSAAEHLKQGNLLQLADWHRRGKQYDPKAYKFLVTRIIEICSPDFFQRLQVNQPEIPVAEGETAVFVVGLPRSGTTLVEQILASHSRVFRAGEIQLVHETFSSLGEGISDCLEGLRRLDRETACRLAVRHLEKLRALATTLRIVDKMPENYMYLGLLQSSFREPN